MYCEKCGTQLPDSAEFCISCGTKVARLGKVATDEKIQDTEVQLRIQPTFKLWYTILIPISIFSLAVLILSLLTGIVDGVEQGMKIFLGGFCFEFVLIGLSIVITKAQYNSWCFDFYKTKVIYRDSFVNLSEKEVKYKYIREIAMQQTYLQRYFNLGSIVLYTNAETGNSNGIRIVDVENVHDVYKEIKAIIDV